MSEISEKMIQDYLNGLDEPDTDSSVRETAAGRLWQTGDPESQAVAERIWKLLGTSPEEIEIIKQHFSPKKTE